MLWEYSSLTSTSSTSWLISTYSTLCWTLASTKRPKISTLTWNHRSFSCTTNSTEDCTWVSGLRGTSCCLLRWGRCLLSCCSLWSTISLLQWLYPNWSGCSLHSQFDPTESGSTPIWSLCSIFCGSSSTSLCSKASSTLTFPGFFRQGQDWPISCRLKASFSLLYVLWG